MTAAQAQGPGAVAVAGAVAEDMLLPPPAAGVPPSRRWAGLAVAVLGLPLLTVGLVDGRESVSLGTMLLLYLLVVVLVAVVGGTRPAVLAAVASSLLANWYLTPPYHTLVVEQRDSVLALAVFVVVALLVSVTVELAASRRAAATRSSVEAELLSRYTAEPLTEASLPAVLERVRVIFGMETVALLDAKAAEGMEVARVGPPMRGSPAKFVPMESGLRLVAAGPEVFAADRRLLGRLADTAARAYEGQRLAEEASRARALAQVDSVRAALLAAVGHDLRTPLAGIKAAVSSLRQEDVTWTAAESGELLATIESSADRLDDLIGNLLAMSRLQAGAVSVVLESVALDGIVASALLGLSPGDVVVDVPDDLPSIHADAGLLERVVANLVGNARRFSPQGRPVEIRAEDSGEGSVRLHVIDHGAGVAPEEWPDMFVPFQRLDDHSVGGVGLGLAIARGFTEAMHGRLTPSSTPGGGLTMTATLRCAP